MRLIIDSLVAMMLTGILAGVVLHARSERKLEQRIELTRSEVHRFHSQIMLQSALEKVELTQRGYPRSVDQKWFADNLPVNPLLGSGHPWVEIAGESQRSLRHPPNRIAFSRDVAQFWYNPSTGDVRARVPSDVSDATAVRLYNLVNDSHLPDIFASAG